MGNNEEVWNPGEGRENDDFQCAVEDQGEICESFYQGPR